MPRGPAPGWRARKPVTVNGTATATAAEVDAWVIASVSQAGGRHHPETGHYATLVIRGLASKEEAAAWKQALFRCAHYLNRNGIAAVSMSVDKVQRDGAGFKFAFRAVDKTLARAHVMKKYGPDRSKWPYDPRRRGQG
jgi:hypothetical protein